MKIYLVKKIRSHSSSSRMMQCRTIIRWERDCCDRVWADDAAQARLHDRGLNQTDGLTPRKCSRRIHCNGKARGWNDRWHRPLSRDPGHREQQPGTPAPHRCNEDRHRAQREPSQPIKWPLYRPKKDDPRTNPPFPHTIHAERLTMILTSLSNK